MKRIIAAFALFACAFFVKAYDIVATVSIEGNTKWYFDIELANNDIDFTAFQLDITLDSEDAEMKQTNMLRRWLMVDHNIRLTRRHYHQQDNLCQARRHRGGGRRLYPNPRPRQRRCYPRCLCQSAGEQSHLQHGRQAGLSH